MKAGLENVLHDTGRYDWIRRIFLSKGRDFSKGKETDCKIHYGELPRRCKIKIYERNSPEPPSKYTVPAIAVLSNNSRTLECYLLLITKRTWMKDKATTNPRIESFPQQQQQPSAQMQRVVQWKNLVVHFSCCKFLFAQNKVIRFSFSVLFLFLFLHCWALFCSPLYSSVSSLLSLSRV